MKNILISLLTLCSIQAGAQKMMTKTGTIEFVSKTPLELIIGTNKSVACLYDTKTGSLDFILQNKSFVFDKQLLQEHFNENYMESDKFPKSSFKGTITNYTSINLAKDGEYDTEVVGKLTIHGTTKDIKSTGKIVVKNGKPTLMSTFTVLCADYNIAIPGAVKDKISKDVKISVNCSLDALK